MFPCLPDVEPVRPSAVVDAEIRVLARRASWLPGELAEYRRLVAEYLDAVARERLAQTA